MAIHGNYVRLVEVLLTLTVVVGLFSFGGSYYDVGNKRLLTDAFLPQTTWPYGKSTDDPNGRFSDGHIVPDSIGFRRRVTEEMNKTLILAAERTHRRDPLNHFHYYTGGWNVSDTHYIASVVSSAAPVIIAAVAMFLLFLPCIICACLCRRRHRNTGDSRGSRTLSLAFLVLFTIATTIGIAVLYSGRDQFFDDVNKAFEFITGKTTGIETNLTGIWDYIQSTKDIQFSGQFLFPPDMRLLIDSMSNRVSMPEEITLLNRVTNDTIHYLQRALTPLRVGLDVIVLLLIALMGLLMSRSQKRAVVYVLIFVGWLLVTTMIVFSATFLVLHNVVGDTCLAINQWVQNRAAESTLSLMIPCVDNRLNDSKLHMTQNITLTSIDMSNIYVTEFANEEFPPDTRMNFNQSGPLVPVLCNFFNVSFQRRQCAQGEISLGDASQIYQRYVCRVNSKGICVTQGRLTPSLYNEIMQIVTIAYTMDKYESFMENVLDCSLVSDTFISMTKKNCPGLITMTQWMFASLAIVSAIVAVSVIVRFIIVID